MSIINSTLRYHNTLVGLEFCGHAVLPKSTNSFFAVPSIDVNHFRPRRKPV